MRLLTNFKGIPVPNDELFCGSWRVVGDELYLIFCRRWIWCLAQFGSTIRIFPLKSSQPGFAELLLTPKSKTFHLHGMDFQLMYTWYQLISRLYIYLHPLWHVNPTWYLWLAANKPCSKDKRWCGESSPGVAPTRWMLQHVLTWNLISKPAWCRDGFHQFFHLQGRSIQQTERPISDVCNNILPRHRQQTATEFPRAGEAVGVEKLQQGFEGGHIAICNGNLLPGSCGIWDDFRWFSWMLMDFHTLVWSYWWFRVVFQTREFFRKSAKPAPWRSTPEDQWWVASQRLQSEHKGSENELWWSHHSPRRWRHLKSGFTGFSELHFFRPNGNKRLTAFLPCLPSLPSSNWGSDCICLPHEHNTSCSVNERDTLQVIGTEIRTSSNARISALIVGCGTSTCGFKGARPYLGKVTVYNTATSYNKNKMHK